MVLLLAISLSACGALESDKQKLIAAETLLTESYRGLATGLQNEIIAQDAARKVLLSLDSANAILAIARDYISTDRDAGDKLAAALSLIQSARQILEDHSLVEPSSNSSSITNRLRAHASRYGSVRIAQEGQGNHARGIRRIHGTARSIARGKPVANRRHAGQDCSGEWREGTGTTTGKIQQEIAA